VSVKKLAQASAWLPYVAAAFALVFAVVILSDAATTLVFNGFAQQLSESPTVLRYAAVHLATGTVLLVGAVAVLLAMESRSRAPLVLGEVFASVALVTIVIFERLSLWTLPYVD
jgi:hypothetical protein